MGDETDTIFIINVSSQCTLLSYGGTRKILPYMLRSEDYIKYYLVMIYSTLNVCLVKYESTVQAFMHWKMFTSQKMGPHEGRTPSLYFTNS